MKKSALILVLMFLAVYIAPIGMRPMVQPDEVRYAEVAREMLASGDYITPRLDGLRYFEKPVFGYWLFAASMHVFGGNAFALRLPCALATGFAALAIFLLVRRFAGGYLPGLMAASVFLTMPLVFIMSNLGVLDGILNCLLTLALCFLYYALMENNFSFKKICCLLACGAFCGFAFMTKGFLAFAVPALTVSAFLIWERRWKDFLTLPWIPGLAAFAVSLPWALEIHQAEPGFWHYFFWIEHIQRFFGEEAAQHAEAFWFFIPILLGGAAIWVFPIPSAILGLRDTGVKNPLIKYCLCWLTLPFLFFSFSTGKLPPYILPCFTPLSILLALGLHKCHNKSWTKEFQIALWPLAIALAILLPLFAINQLTGWPVTLYLEGEGPKWILDLAAGLLWLLALILALKETDFWKKFILFCLGPAPFLFAFNFIMPERIIDRKAPAVFLERNAHIVAPETAVVSWRDPAQSVCWALKRSDVWLYLSGGEMDDGLKFPDSQHRFLDHNGLVNLIEDKRDSGGLLLILPLKIFDDAAPFLPRPQWTKIWGGEHGYMMIKF